MMVKHSDVTRLANEKYIPNDSFVKAADWLQPALLL